MAFEKKVPEWYAAGAEPPESLKTTGFEPGYKPPADFLNWFWHGVSECLTELQGINADSIGAMKAGTVPVTSGGTGATGAGGAVKNLFVRPFISSAAVVDCNTLTEIGIYKVYINEPTDYVAYNLPTRYGILFVIGSMETTGYAYVSQLFYDAKNNRLYQRTSIDGGSTWNGWNQFYSANFKPSASDVGAAPATHKHSAGDINSGVLALANGGTGATGAAGATKNLLVRSVINSESGVDCNTLINTGIYKVYIEATAQLSTHNVPARYGVLFVVSSMEDAGNAYVSQLFYDVLNNRFYQRTSTNSGSNWSEWSTGYSTLNKPSLSELGAAPAYEYSTTDLTAGESALATGKVYLVYE